VERSTISSLHLYLSMWCMMYRNTSWWQTVNYFIVNKVLPTASHLLPPEKHHLGLRPRGHKYPLPICPNNLTIRSFIIFCDQGVPIWYTEHLRLSFGLLIKRYNITHVQEYEADDVMYSRSQLEHQRLRVCARNQVLCRRPSSAWLQYFSADRWISKLIGWRQQIID